MKLCAQLAVMSDRRAAAAAVADRARAAAEQVSQRPAHITQAQMQALRRKRLSNAQQRLSSSAGWSWAVQHSVDPTTGRSSEGSEAAARGASRAGEGGGRAGRAPGLGSSCAAAGLPRAGGYSGCCTLAGAIPLLSKCCTVHPLDPQHEMISTQSTMLSFMILPFW